jgi:hypothetical protein
MLADMNMPPPPKPMFAAEEDGFFFDVYVDRKGPFAIGAKDEERIFSAEARTQLAALKAREAELKKSAPPEPDMACGVEEGDPVNQKIFKRGDYNSLGEDAPKAAPLVLTQAVGLEAPAKGSGRLELANWLASRDNPLTARVLVNRIWAKHFGEGIVRTPDNFGAMGERPTHPELLDYLATQFMNSNWSMKAVHRMIMLSSAYQMASTAAKEALDADPENRLLTRFNRRRLDVEELRDGLLAIGGSIDLTKRRTVYLPLRRANLPSLLNLFDFGDATTTMGKRVATNVAPQALFMMNSAFLTDQSAALAQYLLNQKSLAPAQRVERAYLAMLNRPPVADEVDAGLSYVARFQERFKRSEKEAWQSMCRVLMASNDFIYVD